TVATGASTPNHDPGRNQISLSGSSGKLADVQFANALSQTIVVSFCVNADHAQLRTSDELVARTTGSSEAGCVDGPVRKNAERRSIQPLWSKCAAASSRYFACDECSKLSR